MLYSFSKGWNNGPAGVLLLVRLAGARFHPVLKRN